MNIKTRRTIRKYTQQPIPDELLNQLLEDAARTQTMGNLQLYSVVVTRDEEKKQKLASLHFNQPCATGAAVLAERLVAANAGCLAALMGFCISISKGMPLTFTWAILPSTSAISTS